MKYIFFLAPYLNLIIFQCCLVLINNGYRNAAIYIMIMNIIFGIYAILYRKKKNIRENKYIFIYYILCIVGYKGIEWNRNIGIIFLLIMHILLIGLEIREFKKE